MICELDRAAGDSTVCPEETCPFWADSRCVVAGLRADLAENPGLVALLFELRERLRG